MAKQIKLTDSVAAMLEERAQEDNLSLAGEVNKLLTEGNSIVGKLDYLEGYIDKRFSELLSAINDTAVDRLAGGRAPRKKESIELDWPDVQYLMFELLEDDAPEWTCKEASRGAHESSDLDYLSWKVDDEFIFTDNGKRTNWLTLSPRIKSYLGEHYGI